MSAKKPRLKSGFTLGGEQAEADPLLSGAFFNSSDYDVIRSRSDPRCFIVGRTGAGKSAAFQKLEDEAQGHCIRINPEDLALPYITDLGVIRYLDSLDVNLDLFWTALWKHVLLVEVLRHRYRVNEPAAKQKFLDQIREKISRDPAKQAALDYLDEFEGRFWCEAEERVRDITDKFTQTIGADASLKAGPARLGAAANAEISSETRKEEADRYQRVVNATQISKLNKMIAVLNEDVLDDQHFTYVVIDDLDRDWVDERLANDLVRCLFRTVLDLKRVSNLKVLVALRTNLFQELDFGRRGGGQEEKFRSLVLRMRWTESDLEELLDERVRVAAPPLGLDAHSVRDLVPNPNRTRGSAINYILDRTLLRPRDAIAFMNECLGTGVGKTRLSWEDIHSAEATYSANRLLALRDEWKTTYPGIARVFDVFRGCQARMTISEYTDRLDSAFLVTTEPNFEGIGWMTDLSEAVWSSGKSSWAETYGPLSDLLYQLGLVGFAVGQTKAPQFHSESPRLLGSAASMEKLSAAHVHRMYHAALDVRASS